jgi:outer membrane protein W
MSFKRVSCVALILLLGSAAGSAQQRPESEQEVNARLARQGAGLFAGIWNVQETERTGVVSSTWPLLEGYFQRGMDLHLAIESSVGLWRQEETETHSGLGGQTTTRRTTYIVPLLSGLRFYPMQPAAGVQPHVGAAVGLALGIEDAQGADGGLLGGGGGTRMETGFGFRGGAGVEVSLSRAFGAGVNAGYQWLRFGSAVGGLDTYRGVRATAGLTYRFQY